MRPQNESLMNFMGKLRSLRIEKDLVLLSWMNQIEFKLNSPRLLTKADEVLLRMYPHVCERLYCTRMF